MGFIKDFVYYNSGDECPEQFWLWSGLTLFGSVLGRKVWYMHGKFPIYASLYTTLIGDAGSGKSTARIETKRTFVEHFPTYLHSASIQSREDILKKMASPDCVRTWKLTVDSPTIHEYRPFFIIANEISNFVSVDKGKMIDFLVDIFDENWYSTGFKNAESQDFKNPFVSVLACGIPEWLMSNLRLDLFTGGLGRRLLIVYGQKRARVADPVQPRDFQTVKDRAIEHLKEASLFCGELRRTHAAATWWKEWYENGKNFATDDPILRQFYQTKHIYTLKVAILIALDERPFKLELTDVHMQTALAMLSQLEPDVIRLTRGTGRNELAGIGAQLLEALRLQGGMGIEKKMHALFFRHLREMEWIEVCNALAKTDQIIIENFKNNGSSKLVMFLPDRYREIMEERKKAEAPPDLSTASTPPEPSHGPESTGH